MSRLNQIEVGGTTYDIEDYMAEVSGSTSTVSVTLADNTKYTYTNVSSLTIVGSNVTCMGTITFGTSAPTVSISGFVDVDGDDVTSASASETWEFNVLNGRCLWKNWG